MQRRYGKKLNNEKEMFVVGLIVIFSCSPTDERQ